MCNAKTWLENNREKEERSSLYENKDAGVYDSIDREVCNRQ